MNLISICTNPEAQVIALSPKTLMATNRFLCETCGKGFQRDQNLQLHRRGHNLPWKLKQRTGKEARKRVYVCPEKSCVHHDPSRLKSTSAESTVKRSGSARSARSVMLCSQIGKHTPRPVALENINVIVELSFQGN